MPEPLTPFIEALLVRAGMTQLPADFRQQYVTKLVSQLEERIGLRSLRELDEEQLADFERLTQSNAGPSATLDFFRRHVRDFETKMGQIMQEFSQEFLVFSASARKELQSSGA